MSRGYSISKTSPIVKFLIELKLLLLLTKPQFKHVATFIAAATQPGFRGKVTDVVQLSFTSNHRTTFGEFLANAPWDEMLLLKVTQRYTIEKIKKISYVTKQPIYVIIDDTISKKTMPSSKARRYVEKCGFHQSHLEKKMVYGHQLVTILLQCNGVTLPYTIVLYEKEKMSKIQIAMEVVRCLPEPPYGGFVLADSWYSCNKLIKASADRGYNYIGGLKTNRVIYPTKSKLGEQIQGYAKKLSKKDVHLVTVGKMQYYVHRYEGSLNGISKAVVLLSWPKDALFKEHTLRAFISTETSITTEAIVQHYSRRWPIEIFIRNSKMNLGLNKYQVQSEKAIKRFWILLMLAYTYCETGVTESPCTFGKGLKIARRETQKDVIQWVHEQTKAGIHLDDIFVGLKIA